MSAQSFQDLIVETLDHFWDGFLLWGLKYYGPWIQTLALPVWMMFFYAVFKHPKFSTKLGRYFWGVVYIVASVFYFVWRFTVAVLRPLGLERATGGDSSGSGSSDGGSPSAADQFVAWIDSLANTGLMVWTFLATIGVMLAVVLPMLARKGNKWGAGIKGIMFFASLLVDWLWFGFYSLEQEPVEFNLRVGLLALVFTVFIVAVFINYHGSEELRRQNQKI